MNLNAEILLLQKFTNLESRVLIITACTLLSTLIRNVCHLGTYV